MSTIRKSIGLPIRLMIVLFGSVIVGTGCVSAITDRITAGKEGLDTLKNIQVDLSTGNDHHTVIVPGYGAPVAGNATYEGYIEEVAEYVEDDVNGVDSVVFTGSYSTLQNTSEAESMNSYFNSVADITTLQARGVKVLQEDCAIVSWQNISNSKDVLAEYSIAPGKVTVFGDENRKDKLESFATYKFNEDQDIPDSATDLLDGGLHYTEINFQGYDFGNSAESEDERNAKFAAEIAAAYDAELGNELLKLRIGQWTTEFGYDVADNLVTKGCTEYKGFLGS